jgi:hypothetical protein
VGTRPAAFAPDDTSPGSLAGMAIEADVSLLDEDDVLRAAFAPAQPLREPSDRLPPERSHAARQHGMMAAAEAYAQQYQNRPKQLRWWAESAPLPVRSLFLAIRQNTPGGQLRAGGSPLPYRYDASLPRVTEVSEALRAMLEVCWPIWGEGAAPPP